MKRMLVLLIVFMLIGCSKGAEVSSKVPEEQAQTSSKIVEVETEDVVEEKQVEPSEAKEEPIEAVDELQDYEPPAGAEEDECMVDSKGVVRVYHASGSKTVYRDECVGGILTEYNCINGEVSQTNAVCPSGICRQGPYGDTCGFA